MSGALPKLAASLDDAFFVPVIDSTTSDAAIPFERNVAYDDASGNETVRVMNQDRQYLSTFVSDAYITAHLVGTFQGRPAGDPDPQTELTQSQLAETCSVLGGTFVMGCLIHKEVLRDYGAASEATVVVHEVGYLFQRPGEDFHTHGGVMAPTAGPSTPTTYAPATLERIRNRNFSSP